MIPNVIESYKKTMITDKHTIILILLIFGLIINLAILTVVEIPKSQKQGFGQGYVCAFDHEQEKQQEKNETYIVYETEKTEYCEKFSKLFDEAIEDVIK